MPLLYKFAYYSLIFLLSVLGLWTVLVIASFFLLFGNPAAWFISIFGSIGDKSFEERQKELFGKFLWAVVITILGAPNIAIVLLLGIIYFGELIGAV